MITQIVTVVLASSLVSLGLPSVICADVLPQEIVVLANAQDSSSQDLARYYIARRGIPIDNRIDLDLPTTETISREVYDDHVVKPVQEALRRKGIAPTVKVLVPVFGMPLRVRPPSPNTEEKAWIEDARQWMQSAVGLAREEENRLHAMKVDRVAPPQAAVPRIPPWDAKAQYTTSQIRKWRKQLVNVLHELSQAVNGEGDVKKNGNQFNALQKIQRRLFGKAGVRGSFGQLPEKVSNHLQRLLTTLMYRPTSEKRTQAYRLVQEGFGVWGILAFAHWEMGRYKQADGGASVDSELSFLWWETGTYPLAGRLPNPFYLRYDGKVEDWPLPLLMVSRIDAPTAAHARAMIDQGIETEARGLSGKVYVDTRGMKQGPPLSYGFYDTDMQNFAQRFRENTSYPIVLENTEKRFSQPGQAPDVALYVGWYRLRHYEDAFTFNPGAIGYHIASGEAVSIHNPKELGWCKNALERGITATLGPVGEPYLDAFPLPTEFFGLLYAGKYSLVEAYYLSTRYLSWKMVLFGDPLYRPWLKSTSGQAQAAQTLLQNRPFPVSPTQVGFPAPDVEQDFSKFPGKYVAFDSRMLSP